MQRQHCTLEREPIYSEIEEDCMLVSGSPQFDVRTEAHLKVAPTPTPTPAATPETPAPTLTPTPTPTTTVNVPGTISETTPLSSPVPPVDISALYAQVQKTNKTPSKATPAKAAPQPRALGQFLQESLQNGSFFQFMPLPDEPTSDSSYVISNSNSISNQATLPMHQSLNNINEQHSPPKKNRNLSKSELSLQRSEIFLENLCRSEIVLDPDDNVRLEKVQNVSIQLIVHISNFHYK